MKRTLILGCILILSLMVVTSFVHAEIGSGKSGSQDKDSKDKSEDNFEESELKIETETENGKQKIKIKSKSDNSVREVESEVEVETETEDGESKLKVKVNGNSEVLGVTPEVAVSIAEQVLADSGAQVTLLESDDGVVYLAESESDGKFLGLIKMKVRTQAEINAETGEVTKLKKKGFFSFLTTGVAQNHSWVGKKTTICHKPTGLGNTSMGVTLSVGTPAVPAHLRHGDYLGACNGTVSGNNTNMTNNTNITGNQSTNSTNVTIPTNTTTNPPVNNTNITISGNQTTSPPTNNTNVTVPTNTNSSGNQTG